MANFPRINPAGFAFRSKLPSSWANAVDRLFPKLINAGDGSEHAPSSPVAINGEGLVARAAGRTFELSDTVKGAGDIAYVRIYATASEWDETSGTRPVFQSDGGGTFPAFWACVVSNSTRGLVMTWVPPPDALEVVSISATIVVASGGSLPAQQPRVQAQVGATSVALNFAAANVTDYAALDGSHDLPIMSPLPLGNIQTPPPSSLDTTVGRQAVLIRLLGESGANFSAGRQEFGPVVIGYRTIGFRV